MVAERAPRSKAVGSDPQAAEIDWRAGERGSELSAIVSSAIDRHRL